MPGYEWDFKMDRYDNQIGQRVEEAQTMLSSMRTNDESAIRRSKMEYARSEALTAHVYRTQTLSRSQIPGTTRQKSVI